MFHHGSTVRLRLTLRNQYKLMEFLAPLYLDVVQYIEMRTEWTYEYGRGQDSKTKNMESEKVVFLKLRLLFSTNNFLFFLELYLL